MSIGILVLLSVGSVLIVNWLADRRIVQEFTSRLIARTLSAEGRALRAHLDAAVNQGDFIAANIDAGRFQFGGLRWQTLLVDHWRRPRRFTDWLWATLTANFYWATILALGLLDCH